jgi:hypothetical protein
MIRDGEKREAGKLGSLGSWEKDEALRAVFIRLRRKKGSCETMKMGRWGKKRSERDGEIGRLEVWEKKHEKRNV